MNAARRPATFVRRVAAASAAALVALAVGSGGLAGAGPNDAGPNDAGAGDADAERAAAVARVERIGTLVEERYWDLSVVPVSWDEVRARARAEAEARAHAGPEAIDAILVEMVDALADDHSRYLPPSEVDEVRDAFGDLPCIGVFGQAATPEPGGAHGPVSWRLVAGDLSVIRVEDLARAGTADGVRRAVEAAERAGAEAHLLDLRGNPGGRLVEMMATAGVFERGFLWRVVTRWSLPLPYPALGTPATDRPLAVWIDGNVHSAAEGLAGGLQASGRATVFGPGPSAGNVEAVLPFCLRDGSQLWIATGVLAPIGAPTWLGEGVRPDAVASGEDLPRVVRSALLGR